MPTLGSWIYVSRGRMMDTATLRTFLSIFLFFGGEALEYWTMAA